MKFSIPLNFLALLLLYSASLHGQDDSVGKVDSLYRQGLLAVKSREYATAEKWFRSAMQLGEETRPMSSDSTSWNAYVQSAVEWGDLYFRNKETPKALEIFLRGLQSVNLHLGP